MSDIYTYIFIAKITLILILQNVCLEKINADNEVNTFKVFKTNE